MSVWRAASLDLQHLVVDLLSCSQGSLQWMMLSCSQGLLSAPVLLGRVVAVAALKLCDWMYVENSCPNAVRAGGGEICALSTMPWHT